ncbi:MAG: hypothetical protein MRJ52_11080 [Nitrosomonas sp.]|nr:hypothetical protein [Nitrosomonas sp.]
MTAWQASSYRPNGADRHREDSSSEHPDEFGDVYPFITPSDIPSTQKHIETERCLSERGMESFKRIQLPRKSVCVVCIGATVGKTCMTSKPSTSNQQNQFDHSLQGKSDPDFVYYISTTPSRIHWWLLLEVQQHR